MGTSKQMEQEKNSWKHQRPRREYFQMDVTKFGYKKNNHLIHCTIIYFGNKLHITILIFEFYIKKKTISETH